MSEIKGWDTVFFIEALNQNIGIRVYYTVDAERCDIKYGGQSKEFGVTARSYANNPKKGDTTTYTYEFNVVTSDPYTAEEDGKKFRRMDVKVDAIQNTEIKNTTMCAKSSEFLDDGKDHKATWSTECS